MSVKYTAQAVIDIALSEVGYLEKASNADLYSKTGNAGSNNYTKYAYEINAQSSMYNGNKNGYAWCDAFNDWCHWQAAKAAGGTWHDAQTALCQADKGAGAGCEYSYSFYAKAGRAGKTPQVGAQIFFGTASNIKHTGIVYATDSKYVYTVEGNTSGASGVIPNGGGVCKKSYLRTSSDIYAYGYPIYADSATTTSTTSSSGTTATKSTTTTTTKEEYPVAKTYKNGSTTEPVYSCTHKETKTGELNKYEQCECLGQYDDMYLVVYGHDSDGKHKAGFVSYSGGVK